MSGSFAFGFSGEDIDLEDDETETSSPGSEMHEDCAPDIGFSQPVLHSLEDMLSPLAPHTIPVTSSTIPLSGSPITRSITIPHRAPFDIRMSLMASASPPPSPLLRGTDLIPGSYEGGWQIWEGCIDLVRFLDCMPEEDILRFPPHVGLRIIELGAGIALPSLYLFHRLLCLPAPITRPSAPIHIVVSDYNSSVLELATIPAFLLVWAFHHKILASSSPNAATSSASQPSLPFPEDLEVTEQLIKAFTNELQARNIVISAVSGSWGRDFVEAVDRGTFSRASAAKTFLLASETIYAPATLPVFTECVMSLLQKGQGKAFVAAKRHYFGVGGSVDDFVHYVVQKGGKAEDVSTGQFNVEEHGVRRCVLEITK